MLFYLVSRTWYILFLKKESADFIYLLEFLVTNNNNIKRHDKKRLYVVYVIVNFDCFHAFHYISEAVT